MKQFSVKPTIKMLDTVQELCDEYQIGAGDLVFASNSTYERQFKDKIDGATIINYRKYGSGEPTDLMVEGICEEVKDITYNRVFAIGGGTILDVAKLFALKQVSPVVDLYDGKIKAEKEKQLILIPTTCGTGSEVTNISILELTTKNTKMGLAVDELYADDAVLIPELVESLPFRFFATSSIDALIPKKSLHEYRVKEEELEEFTEVVMTKQGRLMANNYVELDRNTVYGIYKKLY